MDLTEALRTTGAVREFTEEPVDDATLYDILDTARFAPSGGNRQAWRVIVVRDAETRRALRDLYRSSWYEYLAQGAAGLVAWAPITDREAEARAVKGAPEIAARAAASPGGFAEHFDQVPALLLILADLRALATPDRDLDRSTLTGGASVYPFAWSILLAAHGAGLGGVITTMLTRREQQARTLLGVPDEFAIAAAIVLGHPVQRPTSLRRTEVATFATIDQFGGAPLSPR